MDLKAFLASGEGWIGEKSRMDQGKK